MSSRRSSRGATRRPRPGQRVAFDRWLDRAVDIAVLAALAVGLVALLLTLLR
ncbi:hypothetical protein [Bisbaumannia pacifica]|uniref:Uncharacterized protein n=1 Tax=Bisbaumannia pacifica TaxID=77098 RepID=A0ABD4L553_9GAMM|nr:hypothetical protein [Halomonas pacifica]MBH8581890.1 hypothetical protein [Halomonas pacifica]